MFNYTFLTLKYLIETSAYCFFIAFFLSRKQREAFQKIRKASWLLLCSAALQIVSHYLCVTYVPLISFSIRYIFWNYATVWLFWHLYCRKERSFSSVIMVHLLISNQFCQSLATYVIYIFRSNIFFVTEFGAVEQLISTALIWGGNALIYCFTYRCIRRIRTLMHKEALWINVFYWLFFLAGRLLVRFFLDTQKKPQITVLIFFLFLLEMNLFFAIAMLMVHERMRATEQARMNQQYALQMQHADEINSLYQELRQTRHEMKNQLLYVEHLIKEKDYAALEVYYQSLEEETAPMLHSYDSGNRLVNAILWSKTRTAERHGIAIQLHAAVPEALPIEGHHLCSVLVNLLDNAIEASRAVQKPEICVTLQMKQNYLFCCVSNRIDTDILRQNPELRTTKQDRLAHGFGIRSMKMIAELYDGMTEFAVEDGVFTATVMLSCGGEKQIR